MNICLICQRVKIESICAEKHRWRSALVRLIGGKLWHPQNISWRHFNENNHLQRCGRVREPIRTREAPGLSTARNFYHPDSWKSKGRKQGYERPVISRAMKEGYLTRVIRNNFPARTGVGKKGNTPASLSSQPSVSGHVSHSPNQSQSNGVQVV